MEEIGLIFEENVILKLEVVVKVLNKIVIVDDSGLEVFVLNGELGIYFVCYVGENKSDEVNIEKLLNKFGNIIDCCV